ncbi:hypothetical protein EDD21DRAFT_416644 [Dissophora ornata]|nr:hypothetical protein EDD21DRAFT_416644 [Dissophora ornata]
MSTPPLSTKKYGPVSPGYSQLLHGYLSDGRYALPPSCQPGFATDSRLPNPRYVPCPTQPGPGYIPGYLSSYNMAYNNAYAHPPQPPTQESRYSAFTIEASGQQGDGDSDDDPNEDKDGTMQHNNDEDYSLFSCTSNTGTKDSYHQDAEPDPMHYNRNIIDLEDSTTVDPGTHYWNTPYTGTNTKFAGSPHSTLPPCKHNWGYKGHALCKRSVRKTSTVVYVSVSIVSMASLSRQRCEMPELENKRPRSSASRGLLCHSAEHTPPPTSSTPVL